MKDNIDPKNYTRVFGGPGMPFITSYLFAANYVSVDFLITWKDNMWTAFLRHDTLERTLNEGVVFYSDTQAVDDYHKEYKRHFEVSIAFFTNIINKDSLTRQDVVTFFSHANTTLSLYVKCEFFYVDRAYDRVRHDPVLKKNLSNFAQLKNPGKEQIIRVFFDQRSFIYQMLEILERQFSIRFENLVTYTPDEVVALFGGEIVEHDALKKRKDFYILKDEAGVVALLMDEEYRSIIDRMVPHIMPKKEIRGTVAHTGVYRGTAKLFNHGYAFYKVPQLIQEMKQGDVLVTETTSPELMLACKKAGAIVTNEGGLLSHAAIVSRELNIPCIVGAHGVTSSVQDGDIVEVDAHKGTVKIIT